MSTIIECRLRKLICAVLTCKLSNTKEWMDYFCAEINAAMADLGHKDRFEFKGSLIIKKEDGE